MPQPDPANGIDKKGNKFIPVKFINKLPLLLERVG
jgi:hypothetical protein